MDLGAHPPPPDSRGENGHLERHVQQLGSQSICWGLVFCPFLSPIVLFKTERLFPRVSVGFPERRIHGQNGEDSPRVLADLTLQPNPFALGTVDGSLVLGFLRTAT